MKSKYTLIFIGIVLIAVFFRFYLIREMPGGLFPDEAANGLDINMMDQGILQPFYERGNGREALFFYMLWGSVSLLGRGAWQHHIISALIGVLSVISCYLLTRTLFSMSFRKESNLPSVTNPQILSPALGGTKEPAPLQTPEQKWKLHSLAASVLESKGAIMALLASFLMATSAWHIVLSRTAFRANLIPLMATLTLYFGLKIFAEQRNGRKYWWAILFGVFFGLGFYTYIAYRILVPILGMLILWPLLADLIEKPRLAGLKKYFFKAAVAFIFFLIAFAPLGHYFYTHPGSFVGRSGQVSVFNPELNGGDLLGTILEVTRLSFVGYFTEGDLNWRHNISGEPFLSPIISPFFAIGLLFVTLLAVRYFFRPVTRASDFKHFLLAGWFYGMLLPVITTAEGIPHGLRAIGTIPAVFIITAYGMYRVIIWVSKFIDALERKIGPKQGMAVRVVLYLAGAVLLLNLPAQAYKQYFVRAYNNPENFYAFRSDLTPVSEYLKQYGSKENTYLILDKFSVQTVDYITTVEPKNAHSRKNQPYTQVDPEESWRGVDAQKDGRAIWTYGLKPGDKMVFTQSSIFDIKKFKQHHPNSALIKEVRNKFGQAVLAVYEIQ